jgi:hypothetical protein
MDGAIAYDPRRFYALDVGLGFATPRVRGKLHNARDRFYALDVGLGFATDAVF